METADLTNKTVVITGASSGTGKAAAIEFAGLRANLVLAARNEQALNEVADECRELGVDVLVVPTDVTDAKAVIELANIANDWKNRLDVWVNNAGILAAGEFDKTPMEVHQQVIHTNLLGYMNGAHAAMPIFKAQGYGTIINNISIGGYLPVPYGAGYTASKFGLRGFSEALKGELSAWPDIYVCDLFPPFLDTPGIQHAGNYTGKALKPAPPVINPRRVAQAMVKVACNPKSNSYVSGTSTLLKLSHALFPEITTKLTGFVMRRYFKTAPSIPPTDGNVFNSVDYGMSISGGWAGNSKAGKYAGYAAAGVLAGAIAVLALKKINGKSPI